MCGAVVVAQVAAELELDRLHGDSGVARSTFARLLSEFERAAIELAPFRNRSSAAKP